MAPPCAGGGRWRARHYARHDNQVLGRLPAIGRLVNLRALTGGTAPAPFVDIHGAGYRGIYDLSDPDASLFIIATGQSGNPLPRHYRDLNRIWRQGGYLSTRLGLSPGETRAVTRLEPVG